MDVRIFFWSKCPFIVSTPVFGIRPKNRAQPRNAKQKDGVYANHLLARILPNGGMTKNGMFKKKTEVEYASSPEVPAGPGKKKNTRLPIQKITRAHTHTHTLEVG